MSVPAVKDQKRRGNTAKTDHLTTLLTEDGTISRFVRWTDSSPANTPCSSVRTLFKQMYRWGERREGGAGTHFRNEPEIHRLRVKMVLACAGLQHSPKRSDLVSSSEKTAVQCSRKIHCTSLQRFWQTEICRRFQAIESYSWKNQHWSSHGHTRLTRSRFDLHRKFWYRQINYLSVITLSFLIRGGRVQNVPINSRRSNETAKCEKENIMTGVRGRERCYGAYTVRVSNWHVKQDNLSQILKERKSSTTADSHRPIAPKPARNLQAVLRKIDCFPTNSDQFQ